MKQDRHMFADPATARAFVKYVAMSFQDPVDMSEFLGLCDTAQAVLAYSIVAETLAKADIPAEICRQAYKRDEAVEDLDLVKERMRRVMVKLQWD